MTLPKHKYLLTYRYAEIIHWLVPEFCERFLDPYKHRRLIEQIEPASRSGKQCIMEGVGQSDTSKKGEMKMLGVSKGSYEELVGDFEDFLRRRNLLIWPKSDPRVQKLKEYVYRLSDLRNLSASGEFMEKPVLLKNPEEAANLLLTLCHIETYLLSKQIAALENKFIQAGGFTENLFKKRIEYRKLSR